MGDLASIVLLESAAVKDSLTYEEVLVEILDHRVRRLSNTEETSSKILWRIQSIEGATSEEEAT